MSSTAFKTVRSTTAHPLPPEKKGNLVGNAIVAAGEGVGKVGEVVGYVPVVGTFVEGATKLAVVTPTTAMGKLANFDLKGVRRVSTQHNAEGLIAIGKGFVPGSGIADWVSGKLAQDGKRVSDRIVAATVEGVGGMPDAPPPRTPGNRPKRDNSPA